jgi:hypothetical protein
MRERALPVWFEKWFVSRKQYETDIASLHDRRQTVYKELELELVQMRQTLKTLTDERDQLRNRLALTTQSLNAEIVEFGNRADRTGKERDALAAKLKTIRELACDEPAGYTRNGQATATVESAAGNRAD